MRDRRNVAWGPFLSDHPVGKVAGAGSALVNPSAGAGESQEVPLVRRLDGVTHVSVLPAATMSRSAACRPGSAR